MVCGSATPLRSTWVRAIRMPPFCYVYVLRRPDPFRLLHWFYERINALRNLSSKFVPKRALWHTDFHSSFSGFSEAALDHEKIVPQTRFAPLLDGSLCRLLPRIFRRYPSRSSPGAEAERTYTD